jgi:hypothetical protein
VINRHVVGRVSVIFAANIFGQIIERIRAEVLIPLKHHVLEHVRETAPAGRIVLRADVIPDLDGDDGRVVIFHGVNFETIREGEMLELHRRHSDGRFGGRFFREGVGGQEDVTKSSNGERKFHESPIP